MKLTFGKYKDQELDELVKTDPIYCQWIIKQTFLDDLTKIYIKDLMDNLYNGEYIITFGKYKNKPISIIKDNPHYIKWLKNNTYLIKNKHEILDLIKDY